MGSAAKKYLIVLAKGEQSSVQEQCPKGRAVFLIAKHCSSANTRCRSIILRECAKLNITEMCVICIAACYTRDKGEEGIGCVSSDGQRL